MLIEPKGPQNPPSSVSFHVLEGKIAVWPKKSAKTTPGGLHIPDIAAETGTLEGYVVATGPDITSVDVGDRVVFGKEATSKAVEVDGDVFYIMVPPHVYCVLDQTSEFTIQGIA